MKHAASVRPEPGSNSPLSESLCPSNYFAKSNWARLLHKLFRFIFQKNQQVFSFSAILFSMSYFWGVFLQPSDYLGKSDSIPPDKVLPFSFPLPSTGYFLIPNALRSAYKNLFNRLPSFDCSFILYKTKKNFNPLFLIFLPFSFLFFPFPLLYLSFRNSHFFIFRTNEGDFICPISRFSVRSCFVLALLFILVSLFSISFYLFFFLYSFPARLLISIYIKEVLSLAVSQKKFCFVIF